MARNTTRIQIVNNEKVMVKTMPKNLYNPAIYKWQNQIAEMLEKSDIGFYANKVLKHDNGILHLDYIDFQYNTEPDEKLIGKAMAQIHNYNRESLWKRTSIPIKQEKYNDMKNWIHDVPIKSDNWLFLKSKGIRREIFKSLKTIDEWPKHPKTVLHRDFRLHNILRDSVGYHLIDFDFAAVDYVGLEVMGLFTDLLEINKLKAFKFLEAYAQESIDFDWSYSMVDLFLCYLCTNTFPFSMSKHMDEKEIESLAEERNGRLRLVYEYKDEIIKMIGDINEDIKN